MNDNFARLIALGIVGGVAKALFTPRYNLPRPTVAQVSNLVDTAKHAAEVVKA